MGYHFPNILTDPTIQGTVSAGTGLTMPAFAAGGDISMGANKLKTTDLLLKQLANENILAVRDLADTTYRDFAAGICYLMTGIFLNVQGGYIDAIDADGGYFNIRTRKTGVGLTEVARSQGAADPEFQIGNNGNALRGSNAGYLAFYGTAPIAKQTGVAVTAEAIHAALVNLGLIAA